MLDPLFINAALTISGSELSAEASRASGPGGQNVNKVASKIELRFDLPSSRALDEETKARLRAIAGKRIDADLTVWAAGITAPAVLRTLDLPVSRMGQIVVGPTLQCEAYPDIFAFGDCASCPWPEQQTTVPPRAQAAHQQATFLYDAIRARLDRHCKVLAVAGRCVCRTARSVFESAGGCLERDQHRQ